MHGEDAQVLASMGIRWVLDERTSTGPRGESAQTLTAEDAPRETTTTTTFSNPELILYELPPPAGATLPDSAGLPTEASAGEIASTWENTLSEASADPASGAARGAVLAAHALWLIVLAASLALATGRAQAGRVVRNS